MDRSGVEAVRNAVPVPVSPPGTWSWRSARPRPRRGPARPLPRGRDQAHGLPLAIRLLEVPGPVVAGAAARRGSYGPGRHDPPGVGPRCRDGGHERRVRAHGNGGELAPTRGRRPNGCGRDGGPGRARPEPAVRRMPEATMTAQPCDVVVLGG